MRSRHVAVLLVAALGVLVAGHPAQAGSKPAAGVGVSASVADCRAGWICLYQDANYSGRMLHWSKPGTKLDHLRDYDFNDKMSSWVNNSRFDAMWYGDSSMGGQRHCIASFSRTAHVNPGDSASSFEIFTDDRACN